jgi:predicted nucleic acid-binding protein
VTHPRRFHPPSTTRQAFDFLEALRQTGLSVWLSEGDLHLDQLKSLAVSSRVSGPQIHDTRIAALCLAHGVRELWTADRDFTRYPSLKIRNPLIARR